MESQEPGYVQDKNLKTKEKNNSNYRLIRRTKTELPQGNFHVYINKKNIQHQVKKCLKILENNENEIVLHGIGSAISTTINVALILQEQLTLNQNIAVNTSTVDVLTDFLPLSDDLKPFSLKKSVSAIHIYLYPLFTM